MVNLTGISDGFRFREAGGAHPHPAEGNFKAAAQQLMTTLDVAADTFSSGPGFHPGETVHLEDRQFMGRGGSVNVDVEPETLARGQGVDNVVHLELAREVDGHQLEYSYSKDGGGEIWLLADRTAEKCFSVTRRETGDCIASGDTELPWMLYAPKEIRVPGVKLE